MDFDAYFERLVLREGEWLRCAKAALQANWPHVPAELDRAAFELYEDVFGKPGDDLLGQIDEWFYRCNRDLDCHRPIDLLRTPEGTRSVRATIERMAAGLCA